MRSKWPKAVGLLGLGTGLVGVACVGGTPTQITGAGGGEARDTARRYQVQVVASPTPIPTPQCSSPTRVAIKSVTASSVRSPSTPYFQPQNTIDGITNTAWGANWDDKKPWLRYVFDCAWFVKTLDIKLSLRGTSGPWNERVLVDVYMAEKESDTTLKLVGAGLRPKETVLYTLDIPDTIASKAKLFFRIRPGASGNISDVLVCEVAFKGCRTVACPTPAPTVTPTIKPTPTPSPTATPVPTPTPTGIPSTIPD